MRQWLSVRGLSLALTLFGTATELPSFAQSAAPRRGTPLQFSGRADATNSLGDAHERGEAIQDLEDGLFGTGKLVAPRSSMEGLAPSITIRRTAPSKEMRELLDRRRNWMFASPESLPGGPSTADPSTTLDDLQKAGKLTAVEQYYLEMGRQQNSTTKGNEQQAFSDSTQRDDNASKLPPGVREREEELKRLLTTGLDNSVDRNFEPFTSSLQKAQPQTGFRATALTVPAQNVETRKETPVDQYRQLLGLPSPSLAVADIFKTSGVLQERESASPAPTPQTASSPVVLPGYSRGLVGSQPSQTLTAPTAPGVPQPTLQNGPANMPAKVEPPRRTPPPAPTFTAPRRMF